MCKNTLTSFPSSNLEAVLEKVRADFVLRIHSQIPQIMSARRKIWLSNCDNELKMIEFMAHTTCGIARTIGYDDLGTTAQELEEAISHVRAQKDALDVSTISNLLEDFILEMRSVCSKSNYGSPPEC